MDFVVHQRFSVSGMHCAACANSVASLLKTLGGVREAEVHFATESVVVDCNPATVGLQQFHQTLIPFGFDVEPIKKDVDHVRADNHARYVRLLRRDATLAWFGALPILVLSMIAPHDVLGAGIAQAVLCLALLSISGRGFYLRAWQQLRIGTTSMDTLVALSTGLAFVWSLVVLFAHDWLVHSGVPAHFSFESAAMVVAFVLSGKVLEERARDQSRNALDALQSLQPNTATVLVGDRLETRAIDSVESGDILVIAAGERVAADGLVNAGSSACDESMLSGESSPVPKAVGSKVFAGTVNLHSVLRMEVRSVGDQTVLSSIRSAVRDAQESKVAAQRLVDFVSARFVPAVLILSVLTFVVWYSVGGTAMLGQALNSMIAVLVVACPCALGLAAPIAVVIGIDRAARRGILIRSAEQIERACTVTDIVFDKTGTLSQPLYRFDNTVWFASENERPYILDVIYSAEMHSQHPHAKALREALEGNARIKALDEIQESPGKGMCVQLNGRNFRIGTLAFALEGMPGTSFSQASGIFVSDGSRMLCRFPGFDGVRNEDAHLLRRWKEQGYGIHLLSGDNRDNVERVAEQCGIERWRADQSPEDKEQYIRELQNRGAVVAMVGDGVNDAQSLVRADISIALSGGTDTAVHASGIVLRRNELSLLKDALHISLATRRIIRENLWWAFLYNVLLIPLAAGVFLPIVGWRLDPMYAGAAMALSSISVVSNSLRLRSMTIE